MKKIYLTVHRDLVVEDEATVELEEILLSNISLWPVYIKIEGYLIRLLEVRAILPYDPADDLKKKEVDNPTDEDEEGDIIDP